MRWRDIVRLELDVDRMVDPSGDALSLELLLADVIGPITDP